MPLPASDALEIFDGELSALVLSLLLGVLNVARPGTARRPCAKKAKTKTT